MGLTNDDPLPGVSIDTLETYRDFLKQALKFPFRAVWTQESGMIGKDRSMQVQVLGIDELEDEMYGVFCEVKLPFGNGLAPLVEIGNVREQPNKRLLADYRYWFSTYA